MESFTPIPPQAFQHAFAAFSAGKLPEAEQLCEKIIAAKHDFFDAIYLLAVVRLRLGRPADALESLNLALTVRPNHADALYDRGNTLSRLRRLDEAVESYDRALAVRPNHTKTLNNRGLALYGLKRFDEALVSYDRALKVQSDDDEALINRGLALHRLNRLDEALASYDRALTMRPDHAVALYNRGNVLKALKRLDEALVSYDRALTVRPDYAEVLNNRGNALTELKRFEDALASYDRAVAARPKYAEAFNNRGLMLQELRRLDEALASFDCALAVRPDYADALYNRGNALREMKHFKAAIAAYEQLLIVKPDYEYAIGYLHHSKMHCCDWSSFDKHRQKIVESVRAGKRVDQPFSFLAVSDSPRDQLTCAQTYIRHKYPASNKPVWRGERYRHDKIRVAYLSADFHDHPMAYLMAGLFEQHDRARFETTAISFGPASQGPMRQRLQRAFDRFIDVRTKSDREVACLLRDLEIDIAVDRKGFTLDNRTGIFALRSAPIQVNYLAYPGTIGAEYMDYVLADQIVIPADHHSFFSEKIVYLPDTYQANDSTRRNAAQAPKCGDVGLPDRGFIFCCFNNNYKITPEIFDVWMRLLRAVEGSVLWLLRDNSSAEKNLRNEAAARGIDPVRLVFADRLPQEDHLARHCLADLFVDTLPYNAHTTASDALWAGLPILTCIGEVFAGRVAASLLHAVGVPELITTNLEEYYALALKLACGPTMLAEMRAKLVRNRNTFPLFNTARFARHIDAAYTTMWEIWQRGETPKSFKVEPI